VIRAILPDSIDAWLDKLSAQAAVYVPRRRKGGDVALEPLAQGERARKYRRLAESPKRILLPQMDDLLRFEGGKPRAVLDTTERILFGLRPCDAAAIAILDEFFGRDYPDPNYRARRSRMRLIVSACAESEETCFCGSTDTGPTAVDGFDVQLFDLGDIHLAVTGTPAGEEMISVGGSLFADPPPDAQQRMEEFERKSRQTQKVRLDLGRAQKMIRDHAEPPNFWEKVADRCLICGGCAYLCPTCTCYNIVDRSEGAGKGTRQRLWDTCVLGGFTREASGHNPREAQSLRCGHRYQHKLGGADRAGGRFRCVGCGRCAAACISNVGIIRVVQELLAAPVAAPPAKSRA
jgi:ferredoxin